MKRLFLNRGSYAGERVEIGNVLDELRRAAQDAAWTVTVLHTSEAHPVLALHRLPARPTANPRRVYLSAGIHGDEPAGPVAMLELLRADFLPDDCELFVCPCLNPAALALSRRTDATGVDLNRDYRHPRTRLVRAHRAWLDAAPQFDAALLLHEDWEADGFYLYELCREPGRSLAASVIRAVSPQCPVLQAQRIDDWPASDGVIRPDADPLQRPDWPEALHLFMNKTPLCYTFEAPSDYPLPLRTAALVTAVRAAMAQLASTPGPQRER
jgi:hypothetical protein